MLDACAVGGVFASPEMNRLLKVVQTADSGKGVLCVIGNDGGDRMNFYMTCDMAEMEDIKTATVIVSDDIASAGPNWTCRKIGVKGRFEPDLYL